MNVLPNEATILHFISAKIKGAFFFEKMCRFSLLHFEDEVKFEEAVCWDKNPSSSSSSSSDAQTDCNYF